MGDIAFWTLVALGAAAFSVALVAYDLDHPPAELCHHCGEYYRHLCPEATEATGEPTCHPCGIRIADMYHDVIVCPHTDTATWRREP